MAGFMDDLKVMLSNLFRRGRKGVDTLAVAIDQRTEVARLTAAMRRLNSERGDRITEIGKKVYALHKQGKVRNQDVLVDCTRIDEIGQEIADLRSQIEAVKLDAGEKAMATELEDESPLEAEAGAAAELPEPAPVEPVTQEAPQEVEVEPNEFDLEQATGYELPDGSDLEPAPSACDPLDDDAPLDEESGDDEPEYRQ